MPINDIYSNLPGYVAQINDNGLQIAAPPQAQSQSVLLLGVATDGPVNTPIQIASISDAERIFGVTTKAASITGAPAVAKSLTRGVYEAYQGGATAITLVRVGGTSSALTLADATTPGNAIILSAGYAGAKYNALSTTVVVAPASAASVSITTLDGIVHTIPFVQGVTLCGDLINAINAAQLNITATQGGSGVPTAPTNLTAVANQLFTGGTDGTNVTDAQYSDALTAAYRQLEGYQAADVIVPLGAYLQPTLGLDVNGNANVVNANTGDTVFFGQNLAQFVARLSVRTHSAIGVISTPTLAVPTFTAAVARTNQLAGTTYSFVYQSDYAPSAGPLPGAVLGSDQKNVDIGYLLNVLAGPDVIVNNPQIGNYQIDGAATYAGRIVSLPVASATTNKPITSVLGLAYNMGTSVQDALVGKKFVVFGYVNGGVRTLADQTYSRAGGDFTKLSTLRTTYAAMESVRSSTQGFIGLPANPANLNAMGTAIDSALKNIKLSGALLDYQWQITASAHDQIDGNLRVTLVLTPALQIRKIWVSITLNPGATLAASANAGS